MSIEPHPDTDPHSADLAKKKRSIVLACTLLVVSATALLVLPARLPLPARIFVAATNVVMAAVLWLVVRQKFNGKGSAE